MQEKYRIRNGHYVITVKVAMQVVFRRRSVAEDVSDKIAYVGDVESAVTVDVAINTVVLADRYATIMVVDTANLYY